MRVVLRFLPRPPCHAVLHYHRNSRPTPCSRLILPRYHTPQYHCQRVQDNRHSMPHDHRKCTITAPTHTKLKELVALLLDDGHGRLFIYRHPLCKHPFVAWISATKRTLSISLTNSFPGFYTEPEFPGGTFSLRDYPFFSAGAIYALPRC